MKVLKLQLMNKLFLLLIISILAVQIYGQDIETGDRIDDDYRSLIREGNRQYNAERASDAERSYRRALEIEDRSNIGAFNLGNSLYRQEKFEEAAKEFERAAMGTTDKLERAHAYHNLGNSYLQQNKLQESIDAYKQALRNNPNDLDTKYNLSYAMNLLDQQEQNQDNQDNQDNQENQDQENQENQDQDQQQQDQKRDETQQQQQQISPEDAQRMLDAIAEDEKELLEKLLQQERSGNRNIERNW